MNAMRKLLATAIILAASAAPLLAQDIIKFKDPTKNNDMEGEIASMTYKLVEIDIVIGNGTTARQPADAKMIADLIPSNSKKSFDFVKAEESMANNDFDSAVERFERVKKDARASELQRQLSAINIVRCAYYKGNPAAVVQTAQALRAQKPDSFYVRESFELEFKAHVASRNAGGAANVANAFAAMGNSNGMQEWAKSAELMQAQLAEMKKDWRTAVGIYKKYSRDHDVGDDATLGEMRCLTNLPDWTSLNSRADSIIKDASGKKNFPTRLLIAAYNGKGAAELNGGKAKDALLNFLQGAMVLSKGEQSQEHEASLGYAGVACAKVAAAEKDKAKKDIYVGRAREMQGELVQTYGKQSPYVSAIDAAVKEVK
jgi:hypothetical protein